MVVTAFQVYDDVDLDAVATAVADAAAGTAAQHRATDNGGQAWGISEREPMMAARVAAVAAK